MALLEYLAGLGYVSLTASLGLFLAPDPTGIVPLGAVLGGGLVAVHALVRVDQPIRILLASAGATLALTLLTTVAFAAVGAVVPARTPVSAALPIGIPPASYALVLVSGVAGDPDRTADATEV